MIPGFVWKFVLIAMAVVFLVIIVRSLFTRPNRAKPRDERIRLPRFVAIAAAVLLALGLLSSVMGFGSGVIGSDSMRDPVPFRIASVALVVAGLLVLLAYRNWYLAPGPDAIVSRTVFGAERVIRYRDIASHRTFERRGKRMLVVTSSTGTTLRLNTSAHDVTPLLAAIGQLGGTAR